MFKPEDYEEAIDKLRLGLTQLVPNGNDCSICGDNGHQAWECHHNPLVLMQRVEHAESRWRCFHCNEVFSDYKAAKDHFGNIPTAVPRCVVDKCLCFKCKANTSQCGVRRY